MFKKKASDDGIDRSVDLWVSIPAVLVVLGFALAIFFNPEGMNTFMTNVFTFTTTNFGWVFLVFEFFCLILCGWLIFGKYGNRKFGHEKPDSSTFSFYSMLFVFGSSASIVYWVFIEFYYYLEGPPFGIEPFSAEALKWAAAYPSFHWGLLGFAPYAIMGVCFAFFMHVRKMTTSRVSAVCAGVIGEENANGILGKIIDCIFLIGIIFSNAGYSLGVSIPIVGTFFSKIFGVTHTLGLDTVLLIAVTACMAISMFSGLNKGMTYISNIRVGLFFAVAIFVLVVGDTAFMFNVAVESTGTWLQNFVGMSLYTSATDGTGWSQSWTIFYALFFVAAIVSRGLYYSKLCKGRTVKECVIGILVASSLGCAVFFWTMGGYSISTYLGDPEAFKAMMAVDPYNAITYVVDSLPAAPVIMVVLLVYSFLSSWTFVQSAVYSNAMVSQPNLPDTEEPSKIGRVGWCVVTGVLAIAFQYIGGLQTVKNSMVWAGVPTLIISWLVLASTLKAMKKDWGEQSDKVALNQEKPN